MLRSGAALHPHKSADVHERIFVVIIVSPGEHRKKTHRHS